MTDAPRTPIAIHALVIGEALVDVVVRQDGTTSAHPGGSPANVAIGLGRLGRDAELLCYMGLDDNGTIVRDHVEASGVRLVPGSQSAARTSVATATLDADGAATYEFDLAWEISPEARPRIDPLVVHTGSIAAVMDPGAADVRRIIAEHRDGATITYDPNARPTLMGSPDEARPAIEETVALADVVKVSDEDLEWLYPERDATASAQAWAASGGPSIVVLTRGGSGASAFVHDGRTLDVTAPKVTVADTVGAGDSFMGGLIDGLWYFGLLGGSHRDKLHTIETAALEQILIRCARIAGITVSRPGANPPTVWELGEA
ncbi:carbohydrate kinase family protein [Demequina aurantiaca]|uniref:carbohydrate kinase family protein n=1 Tax=Demequina aurantiaca TaxID=676200 RepID=UPI0007837E5D|nr:carbohydrate kinase [Demequina aurantiaca]